MSAAASFSSLRGGEARGVGDEEPGERRAEEGDAAVAPEHGVGAVVGLEGLGDVHGREGAYEAGRAREARGRGPDLATEKGRLLEEHTGRSARGGSKRERGSSREFKGVTFGSHPPTHTHGRLLFAQDTRLRSTPLHPSSPVFFFFFFFFARLLFSWTPFT